MNRLALLCRVVLSVVVTLGCVLAPLGILSFPGLSRQQILGFRDGVHYYPPLLRYVQTEREHGIPLWNSAEERGRPLLADPTAAVLYPPQWLLIRATSTSSDYLKYVWIHVALAAGTMYLAARRLRVRPPSASLAAVSYAYGGVVLFQSCNLPYLVGAAWLPLGLAACMEVAQYRNRRGIILLAATLVLMVFGGDVESAYLLGLAAVLATLVAHSPLLRSMRDFSVWRSLATAILCVSVAIGLGMGLSAIQWMPTAEWARHSDRVLAEVETASAEELVEESPAPSAGRQSVAVTQRRHEQVRLDFSIGPWRWLELFWCNVGGKPFPQHSRWMTAIPAEGRFWTASLYQGLLPVLLGLSAWRIRRGRFTERWLSWLLLIAVLGSLGRYGLGWVWSELNYALAGASTQVAPELGGVYDLMVKFLPGFALFRYPAKLWIWATAGLSLLAARRWDDAVHQERPALTRRVLATYLIASAALLTIIWAAWPALEPLLARSTADSLFGPLQAPRVKHQWTVSLAQGILIGIFTLIVTQGVRLKPSLWSWLPAVLTAVELSIGHAWLVPTVTEPPSASPSSRLSREASAEAAKDSLGFELVYRAAPRVWYPVSWKATSSPTRLEESVMWDRATLRPKYPLGQGYRMLTSSTSFSSRRQRALTRLLELTQHESPRKASELLRQLRVQTIVGPANQAWPGWLRQTSHNEVAWHSEFAFWRQSTPQPRVWIVPHAVPFAEVTDAGTQDDLARLTAILLPDGQVRDLSREVVLETDHPSLLPRQKEASDFAEKPAAVPSGTPSLHGQARIVREEGGVLEVQTVQPAPGWLVLNDAWLPGWRAFLANNDGDYRPVAILPANGIMRAVALPAGQNTVRFEYVPRGWTLGFWTTALSLVVAVLVASSSWHRWLRRARTAPRTTPTTS